MKTAEEYRQIMLSIIKMSITEARKELDDTCDHETELRLDGYIQGLCEAKYKLINSAFLTTEE